MTFKHIVIANMLALFLIAPVASAQTVPYGWNYGYSYQYAYPYQYNYYYPNYTYGGYYGYPYSSYYPYAYGYAYYPKPTCTLTFAYGNAYMGYGYQWGGITLSWSSSYATTAYLYPSFGSVPPVGSQVVYPNGYTTYTLTVQGPGGTNTCATTIYQPSSYYTPYWYHY